MSSPGSAEEICILLRPVAPSGVIVSLGPDANVNLDSLPMMLLYLSRGICLITPRVDRSRPPEVVAMATTSVGSIDPGAPVPSLFIIQTARNPVIINIMLRDSSFFCFIAK